MRISSARLIVVGPVIRLQVLDLGRWSDCDQPDDKIRTILVTSPHVMCQVVGCEPQEPARPMPAIGIHNCLTLLNGFLRPVRSRLREEPAYHVFAG